MQGVTPREQFHSAYMLADGPYICRSSHLDYSSVFEKQETGEGSVVIEQSRVLAELDPDVVFLSERQYNSLAAGSVSIASVAVQRSPVSVVHHQPSENVLTVLAEHVGREHVSAVDVTDEV